MEILDVQFEDLGEILNLQKLSYISEAEVADDYNIEPLHENLKDVQDSFNDCDIFLKAVNDEGKIIASVRGKELDETLLIEKLFVSPDYRNLGLGGIILDEIERKSNARRAELFTSSVSPKNIYFYKKQGYSPFKKEYIEGYAEKFQFLFFEKNI